MHLYHFENPRRCILLHADLMFMLIFAQPSKSMAAAPSSTILIRSKLFEHAVRMLRTRSQKSIVHYYIVTRETSSQQGTNVVAESSKCGVTVTTWWGTALPRSFLGPSSPRQALLHIQAPSSRFFNFTSVYNSRLGIIHTQTCFVLSRMLSTTLSVSF